MDGVDVNKCFFSLLKSCKKSGDGAREKSKGEDKELMLLCFLFAIFKR